MKKRYWFIILIVIIGLVGVFYYNFYQNNGQVNKSIVLTEKVQKGNIELIINALGTISPKSKINVVSKINSKVSNISKQVGDKVKKDETLIKLDTYDLDKNYNIARYNYNTAIYKRDQLKSLPVTDQTNINIAQQSVNVAYEQMQIAKNNIENSNIKSPIDGTLTSLTLKVGENVSLGQTMFTIISNDGMDAIINVSELDIKKVEPLIGKKIDIKVDAVAGEVLNGTIYKIDSEAIPVNGVQTYRTYISLNQSSSIRSGMSAEVDFPIATISNVLRISSNLIKTENALKYVDVKKPLGKIDPTTKLDYEIIKKYVKTGLDNSRYIEITEGLAEGDEVIVAIQKETSTSIFGR